MIQASTQRSVGVSLEGSGRARRGWLASLATRVAVLFGVSVLVFCVLHAAPGDPSLSVGLAIGEDGRVVGDAARARFRAEHLLDAPLWRQYFHYLGPFDLSPRGHPWFGGSGERDFGGLLCLDFGREFQRPDVAVADELARRLAVTVPLTLVAILLAYGLAVPLGVACARRRGSFFDRATSTLLLALFSVPAYWAALVAMVIFGARGLGWLPMLGLHDKNAAELGPWASAVDLGRHALLPVAVMTYGALAYVARQTRAAMVEALESDCVRAARSRGLEERRVVWRHAFSNAVFPLLTLVGSVLPALVGGSVLVESIFELPGVGRYAYEGFLQRDYNVVMATTLVSAALTLVGLWVSDVLYAWFDPRLRRA
ncbi:MAG: ABC transporter permease [Planctomycetes bacterium]|nr:ABC transporter permease [Planctomycetota bacterium]